MASKQRKSPAARHISCALERYAASRCDAGASNQGRASVFNWLKRKPDASTLPTNIAEGRRLSRGIFATWTRSATPSPLTSVRTICPPSTLSANRPNASFARPTFRSLSYTRFNGARCRPQVLEETCASFSTNSGEQSNGPIFPRDRCPEDLALPCRQPNVEQSFVSARSKDCNQPRPDVRGLAPNDRSRPIAVIVAGSVSGPKQIPRNTISGPSAQSQKRSSRRRRCSSRSRIHARLRHSGMGFEFPNLQLHICRTKFLR